MATRSLLKSASHLLVLFPAGAIAASVGFAACSGSGGDDGGSGDDGSGGQGTAGGGQGAQGGAGGEGATGGTAGSGDPGCLSDADCTTNPAKPKCDVGTGQCVECLLGDPCEQGKYCNPQTFTCQAGCDSDEDCVGGVNLACNTESHTCVGCVTDETCPAGTVCINEQCIAGCTANHPCPPGESCCNANPIGACHNLSTDIAHCGDCMTSCDDLPNAEDVCVNGQCGMGACEGVYEDCNGQVADGCEQNTLQDGQCVCNPGDTQPCYQGAPGTENVGPCKAGTQTCKDDGLGWGPCVGQVLPVAETCANGIDENCDGILDNGFDNDNDGWTICNGDCCDTVGPGCPSPKLINPGAFEVLNNGVDDDCDPSTSDVVAPPPCSTVQKFSSVTADDMVKAMDLCQFTTDNPPMPQKKWGVISAQQVLPSGAAAGQHLSNMQNFMNAVLQNYGVNTPKKGPTMAAISTGRMRDSGDAGFVNPDGGTAFNIPDACPGAYKAGNGGQLPSSLGCNGGNCASAQTCNDGTSIKVQIRTPTNAQSFSYQFKFYSAEFPEWVCTSYNDFYLALLTSQAPGLPADKNISFDSLGNPFSVNNGFFEVCAPTGCHTCPAGTMELQGTGMEVGCPSNCVGGGSVWLTTDAPIVPGETITIEFMTFDVGDWSWDTNVLIDNFTWNLAPAEVGTHK